MSFFDEIDDAPKFKAVSLPGKRGVVTVFVHAVTDAEMTRVRLESAAHMAGLPEQQADKLWRARLIALCTLESDDPNSKPVFAQSELERIANLPYAVNDALFSAIGEVNGLGEQFAAELKKNSSTVISTTAAA